MPKNGIFQSRLYLLNNVDKKTLFVEMFSFLFKDLSCEYFLRIYLLILFFYMDIGEKLKF